MVRIDPADTKAAIEKPHATVMKMRGRTMAGWIIVSPEGLGPRELAAWVKRGVAFARTLPPK